MPWLSCVADRRLAGRPIEALDAEIAAIAQSASAELVPRNVKDFELLGLALHNPWDDEQSLAGPSS